jgi:hypothetical protein
MAKSAVRSPELDSCAQPTGPVEVDAGGMRLGLLAQHAAYLFDERCLLVADAHIGKAVSFRSLGGGRAPPPPRHCNG